MSKEREKADLIIHPVRLRILQVLSEGRLTTQQLSQKLADVPTSSLYRHLKKLLDGGMVDVAETRLVKGVEEKTYRLLAQPHINADDAASMTKADHLRYFTAYLATVIQGFQNYLDASESVNMLADRAGYNEVHFYADNAELERLFTPFNADLLNLKKNTPGNGRRLRKLVVVNHPEFETEEQRND